MRTSPILMLVLAVLFGSGAVFVTKQWLDSQRASLVAPAEATLSPTETLVVAATPLRFGDTLQADNLRLIPWPMGRVPTGAFSSKEEILGQGKRQVVTALETNEPILGWKITGPGQRASLSAVVEAGKRAVTIRVNDVLGVGGFVLPGDRVDILLTRRKRGEAAGEETAYTDILLQGVKVLAIDQSADDRSDDPRVAKSVTLEVDSKQAQKLALASSVGQLALALRNVAAGQAERTDRVTIGDLGGTDSALPEPEQVQPDEAPIELKRSGATVGVIRNLKRSEYQVERGR
jgi:pilus assembly protein CpaB